MKSIIRVLAVALTLALATASLSVAQAKKGYVFKGKVESVGEKALTVANEKVEGWMEAMTMVFAVDKPEVLKTIKAGDKITATVYDGDYVLHEVKVVKDAPGQQKGK
jgi:Cu/Ag efflux protein CusF